MLNYEIFNSTFRTNESDRPYLVFLHGNSGNLSDIKELSHALRDHDIGIVAIDLPGHGKSKRLKSYNLLAMAALVSQTINELQLNEVHLLGHSLGGHVLINGLDLLRNSPKSLWLMGSPPIKINTSFDELFHNPKESQVLFKNHVTRDELRAYFDIVFKEAFSSESKIFDQFLESFRLTDIRFREEFLSSLTSGELQDELNILNRLDCPIHFLIGSDDPLINRNWLKKCSKMLNTWGKDTRVLEIKDACHYPHIEKPNLVKDILLEFFRKLNHSQKHEFGFKNETRHFSSPNA